MVRGPTALATQDAATEGRRGPRRYTRRVTTPTPRPRTAADLLVECLEAEGCRYVFSVPGEETMDLLDALSRIN